MNAPATHSVDLTHVEAFTNLRYMRNVRNQLRTALRELQERIRAEHDGAHNAAALVLDAELAIVEELVRKLWGATGATGPP